MELLTTDKQWYDQETVEKAAPNVRDLSEDPMAGRLDHVVKVFGRQRIERRLSEHAVAARSDAETFEGSGSHGLAMLRRRDEALLWAMLDELERTEYPAGSMPIFAPPQLREQVP